VADGRLAHNPCQGARLPEVPVVEARFLDPDEVVALEAAMAELAPHWAELVPFMADTALRIGEGAGLQVRDVDRAAGTVRVRRTVVEVGGKLTTGAPKTRCSAVRAAPCCGHRPFAAGCGGRQWRGPAWPHR
jgi:integrase